METCRGGKTQFGFFWWQPTDGSKMTDLCAGQTSGRAVKHSLDHLPGATLNLGRRHRFINSSIFFLPGLGSNPSKHKLLTPPQKKIRYPVSGG